MSKITKPIFKDIFDKEIKIGDCILFSHYAYSYIEPAIALRSEFSNKGKGPDRKLRVIVKGQYWDKDALRYENGVFYQLIGERCSMVIVPGILLPEEHFNILKEEYERTLADPKLRKKYID